MIRRSLIILSMTLVGAQVYAFDWKALWSTPDQQGKLLMEQGQYAKAKNTFRHERWSATAAYRAGEYEQAAKLYEALGTEFGYYNLGNALAHQKRYEQAIKAYDQALALNPQNKEALHNRNLLKELMKKDKEQQNKEQQNKEQQNKEQQNKEQQNKEQQNKEQQNKEQQNKEQQDKEQQDKEQQDKEQQDKEQQDKEQQGKEQKDKEQQDKEQKDKEQKDKEQKDKEQKDKEQKDKEQKDKEQKDKELSDKEQDNKKDAKKEAAQAQADREKEQAKQQWLQLIPDDPSGLMREKFLRDHLNRERGRYQ